MLCYAYPLFQDRSTLELFAFAWLGLVVRCSACAAVSSHLVQRVNHAFRWPQAEEMLLVLRKRKREWKPRIAKAPASPPLAPPLRSRLPTPSPLIFFTVVDDPDIPNVSTFFTRPPSDAPHGSPCLCGRPPRHEVQDPKAPARSLQCPAYAHIPRNQPPDSGELHCDITQFNPIGNPYCTTAVRL